MPLNDIKNFSERLYFMFIFYIVEKVSGIQK